MKKSCEPIWSEIVAIAAGESRPEAEAHLAQCPSCQIKLEEMRAIGKGLRMETFDAPMQLVDSAKSLMPISNRKLVARLVRSNWSLAGIRASSPKDVHALFEANNVRLRVQYRPKGKGLEILGNSSEPLSSIVHEGTSVAIDSEGRFGFMAKDLPQTAFTVTVGNQEILVPPIEEAVRDGC